MKKLEMEKQEREQEREVRKKELEIKEKDLADCMKLRESFDIKKNVSPW